MDGASQRRRQRDGDGDAEIMAVRSRCGCGCRARRVGRSEEREEVAVRVGPGRAVLAEVDLCSAKQMTESASLRRGSKR